MGRIGVILAMVLCTSFINPIFAPSLVSYFPMDKQTGNVCMDMKTGDRLVGTGNPYIVNASAYCNGSSSYYEAQNPNEWKRLTNKMSLSFWGKRVTTGSGCFVAALDLGAGVTVWNVQNTTAGNFQMAIISAPSTTNTFGTGSAAYQSANVWRHFVATYDGTEGTAANRVKLYVNGVNISASAAMGGTIPTALYNPLNTTLRIGRSVATYVGNSFIKFVELYDRPLTATEVKDIYVSEYNKINQSPQQ